MAALHELRDTMETEGRLSEVLSEFARTLVTDFPIQAILDHLVRRIVDVLPISGAGVTLISPGVDPRYVAASDDSALRFERLQTGLGEGPCILAYETGEAVSVIDLRDEDRFPSFSPLALAAGLAAVFTFPLRDGDERLGALDLYRTTPGRLDAEEMAAAQTLADVAAAYLLNAQARVDLRESTEQARQNSLHDALTGLPNRALLLERLEHAMDRARRSAKVIAILFVDLDQFKVVNDTYGHHVGDELLVAVARRLSALLRPGDTLARLAGDEFIILCEDLADPSPVEPLAARVGASLAAPFHLEDRVVQVSASVGIAFAVRGDGSPERVLQDADSAMYQAKRRGGASHCIVDLSVQPVTKHRARLQGDLAGALGRRELCVRYQPIVSTVDGQISAAESLLRWAHPTYGIVAQAMVVPLAEQTGLIFEIGDWLLQQTCEDRARWAEPATVPRQMFVSVSSQQLMTPGFLETVTRVLDETGTGHEVLLLQISEDAFVDDRARALVVLGELRRAGVRLALDHFGTGYSSLSDLRSFPLDVVKVDRALIDDLPADPTSRLVLSAVIDLAHGLGMTVVADGVESAEQRAELAALECDFCQGPNIARPMPADELYTWSGYLGGVG